MIDPSKRLEGGPRDPQSELSLEPLGPPAVARSGCARPTLSGLALEDQVGGEQAASGLEEASEERARNGVGRVRNDSKRASWEAQIGGIRLDNDDRTRESPAKMRSAFGVQFDGDDMSTDGNEGASHHAVSRADIENELARPHLGLCDETLSPGEVELVPPPPAGAGGHGEPSPSSRRE